MHFDSWHLRCTLAVSAHLCTSTRSFLARPVDDGLRLWIECVCLSQQKTKKHVDKGRFTILSPGWPAKMVGQPSILASQPGWLTSLNGWPSSYSPVQSRASSRACKASVALANTIAQKHKSMNYTCWTCVQRLSKPFKK